MQQDIFRYFSLKGFMLKKYKILTPNLNTGIQKLRKKNKNKKTGQFVCICIQKSTVDFLKVFYTLYLH